MDLKQNYFEDIRLFSGPAQVFWTIALLAGLVALPFVVQSYVLSIIELMMINAMVALGLNLLVGNTGQVSLGHNGFVAIGAYTVVLLLKAGIPFLPALLAAVMLAAAFGALLGLPSLRLEGPYLAIATMGFGLAVTVIIGRMEVFGGRMGLSVPRLGLKWTGLPYDWALFYLILTFGVLLTILTRSILKSRFGRAFQAIRDSDIAAAAIGVNLAAYKTLSFAISAGLAGFAGGFMALYLGFINPTLFSLVMSVSFLASIVLGGLGSVTGSILGAAVLTFLNLQLDKVQEMPVLGPALAAFSDKFMTLNGLPSISYVITGLILIGIILFEPQGLYGIWMRVKWYWRTWPF